MASVVAQFAARGGRQGVYLVLFNDEPRVNETRPDLFDHCDTACDICIGNEIGRSALRTSGTLLRRSGLDDACSCGRGASSDIEDVGQVRHGQTSLWG